MPPITPEQRQHIRDLFEKFLKGRTDALRKLTISDLNINPFLVRLLSEDMGLANPRAIVEWMVRERFERGAVTSFGNALENAAKTFSEGTGVEGADIAKTKHIGHRTQRYYLQVKSGPNTVPKDLAKPTSDLLEAVQKLNRGSVALFGMCYGNKDQVSSIVQRYVKVDRLIGREFWEFISDDPTCIDEIYKIAAEASAAVQDKRGEKLAHLLERKIDELTVEFQGLYGSGGDPMWDRILGLNS